MRTHLASARVVSELARVDRDVQRLEERWQRDGEVSLKEFWRECHAPATGPLPEPEAVRLAALIKADLRCRFERGDSCEITRYLDHFPEIRSFDSRIVSLIYEEFCLREERGEILDVDGFCGRYPDWKDSLASQLQYHRLFSRAAGLASPAPRYPELGELFEEFELLSLMGKGGSSRVYLASDRSLGKKRVVLKVSLDRGEEHQTQGALDHPHIVPVHSVVYETDTGLRGLTMPYRPGLPLDEIVKRLPPADRRRKALDIWRALILGLVEGDCPLSEGQRAALGQEHPSGDGWDGFPRNGSFAQGAAWIAMVLARTLCYAHQMRTFHRDVKPGNVLLTLHHGPQLLDFNLAESPHSASHAQSAMLGGTLPYMAPEQIQAFLNPDLWGKVGASSDIYSLGLVLRELLTGLAPDLPDDKLPPARAMQELLDRRICLVTDVGQFNPEVPHALRAIVQLCLRLNPDERYPDARALADDLERFLTRGPLTTAHNSSRRERTVNWLVRHRRELSYKTAILVLGGAIVFPLLGAMLKPPPDKHPLMHRAAAALNSDRPSQAIEPLRALAREYPDHPLPQTFLAIAAGISEDLVESEAQRTIGDALRHPDAMTALLDWGRSHPELAAQVSRFVDSQLMLLKEQKRRLATGSTIRDQKQEREVQDRLHNTWRKLVDLGLRLDPQSDRLLTMLPEIDEYFEHFDSAYRRLSDLVDRLHDEPDRAQGRKLLEWSTYRNRVAVKWARKLLDSPDPADARKATELLRQASMDMTECEPFVSSINSETPLKPAGDQAQVIYNFFWIGTETWLSLAQQYDRAGQRGEAQTAYRKAHRYFQRLAAHGNHTFTAHPQAFKDLEARVQRGLRRPSSAAS